MTDDRREWFIYVLRDPRDNEVRYVGFTTDVAQRFRVHISDVTNTVIKSHKTNWIRVLFKLDMAPIIEVIDRGSGGGWQSVEKYWILHYRMQGARLTNATDGGDGALNPSPETREKISKANLGRKQSPESIEKRRQANLGRKQPPDAIERTRQANLGRKHSPEELEKMRQANLGKKLSPEHIEKVSQVHLGRKRSPETREKMRKAHLGIAVRRVEDGVLFASIKEAARSVNRGDGNIRYALKTGTKYAGYHWERVGETPPADPSTLDGNALMMRID